MKNNYGRDDDETHETYIEVRTIKKQGRELINAACQRVKGEMANPTGDYAALIKATARFWEEIMVQIVGKTAIKTMSGQKEFRPLVPIKADLAVVGVPARLEAVVSTGLLKVTIAQRTAIDDAARSAIVATAKTAKTPAGLVSLAGTTKSTGEIMLLLFPVLTKKRMSVMPMASIISLANKADPWNHDLELGKLREMWIQIGKKVQALADDMATDRTTGVVDLELSKEKLYELIRRLKPGYERVYGTTSANGAFEPT